MNHATFCTNLLFRKCKAFSFKDHRRDISQNIDKAQSKIILFYLAFVIFGVLLC